MSTDFIAESVNKSDINRFFEKMEGTGNELHTIQIYADNKKILRIAQKPYSCTDSREVYSLSKTFASTVIGIAADMGLLSVEDKVVDFFSEIKSIPTGFEKLNIKHLLSMNTGHSQCVMSAMALAEKAYEGFFSVKPEYTPGTHFTYNSGASCMLGIILERVSKMSFFDFACKCHLGTVRF